MKTIAIPPAYLWYPKDMISSGRVAALTSLEELWYRRALDQSWLHNGMPVDQKEFAAWVGRRCTTKAAEKIISIFFTKRLKGSTKVFNKKQEIIRTKMRTYRKLKSEAGKRSGVSRRRKRELDAEQNSDSVRTERELPSSYPSSIDLKRLILRACEKKQNAKRDPRLVEIGILHTVLQRNGNNGPIRSVAYFQPEIEKVCAESKGLNTKTIDALLKRRRQQWQEVLGDK